MFHQIYEAQTPNMGIFENSAFKEIVGLSEVIGH